MNYYFFLGWPWNEFRDYVFKNYNYTVSEYPKPAGKLVEWNSDDGAKCTMMIWTEDAKDYPSLAHECLHAANWTLDRAGVKADFMNDEPQTYLMTNLIRQALK